MGERTAAKVCELRKKLMQASGGRDYIETIWGRGYALRDPELKGHTPQQSVRERPERSRSSRNAYRDMRGTDAEGVRCRYFGTRRSRQGGTRPRAREQLRQRIRWHRQGRSASTARSTPICAGNFRNWRAKGHST